MTRLRAVTRPLLPGQSSFAATFPAGWPVMSAAPVTAGLAEVVCCLRFRVRHRELAELVLAVRDAAEAVAARPAAGGALPAGLGLVLADGEGDGELVLGVGVGAGVGGGVGGWIGVPLDEGVADWYSRRHPELGDAAGAVEPTAREPLPSVVRWPLAPAPAECEAP